MMDNSRVGVKAVAMVQDLLIQAYVYLDATPFDSHCAIAAMPKLHLPHAFRVFSHRFALWAPVFHQSIADAQVFTNEALSRG
jgi:hypothetical protein